MSTCHREKKLVIREKKIKLGKKMSIVALRFQVF